MGCNCKKVNNTIRHEVGCDCGPNCSCRECQDKYHGNGMGRYDEYPRPKAAMFDPRKIGQAWPEPNNDPLIPYVRANEQGLPYERLNEYKGMKNSLHGWSTLGDTNNMTNELVTALMHQIQVTFANYSRGYQDVVDQVNDPNSDHSEDLIHLPIIEKDQMGGRNPSFKKGKVVYSNERSIFAFIPYKKGNELGLFIRPWGSEVKKIELLSDKIRLQAPERTLIDLDPQSSFVNNTYPLYFKILSENQCSFEGVHQFASNILDVIIRQSVDFLSNEDMLRISRRSFPIRSSRSAELRGNEGYASKIVTSFIMAEAKGVNEDLSLALTEAITKILSSDFKMAWAEAFYKYEFETFGSNEFTFFDPFAKDVFGSFGSSSDVFVSMLSPLLYTSFSKILKNRYELFENAYKASFDLKNLRDAKERVAVLESEIQNLRASGGAVDSRIVKLQEQLNAKIEELESLRQSSSLMTTPAGQANAKPKMGELGGGSKIAINLAIAGIVGGAIWYVNKK